MFRNIQQFSACVLTVAAVTQTVNAGVVTEARTFGSIKVSAAAAVPFTGAGTEGTDMLVTPSEFIGADDTAGFADFATFAENLAAVESTGGRFGLSASGGGEFLVDATTVIRQTFDNDTGGLAYFRWSYEILPGFIDLTSFPGADISGEFEWTISINGVQVSVGAGLAQIVGGVVTTSLTGDALNLADLSISGTDISWGRSLGVIDLGLFQLDTVAVIDYRIRTVAMANATCIGATTCPESHVSFDDPPGSRFVMARVAQPSPFDLPPDGTIQFYDTFDTASQVPAPEHWLLFLGGAVALGAVRRRRKTR